MIRISLQSLSSSVRSVITDQSSGFTKCDTGSCEEYVISLNEFLSRDVAG